MVTPQSDRVLTPPQILLDVVMVPIMWVVVLLVLRKLADFLVIAFCPPRAIDLYEALEPDQWALWGFAVVCNVCWVLYHATSPRPRVVGARSRP